MFGGCTYDYHRRNWWLNRHRTARRLEHLAEIEGKDRLRLGWTGSVHALRRAICARRGYDMAEYVRRLDHWRYWRHLLTQDRDRRFREALKEQQEADTEALVDELQGRREYRRRKLAEGEVAAVLDEVRAEHREGRRLDESFKGC